MEKPICNICSRCNREIWNGDYEVDDIGEVYCSECAEEIFKFIYPEYFNLDRRKYDSTR